MNIKWEERAPIPEGRRGHTAVWLNGLVYVGGGYEPRLKSSSMVNCYDPVSNSWRSSIDTPYYHFAMTTLNNKLVTAGGEDKSRERSRTNQISTMIMNTGQLKKSTKMITARSYATAVGHQGMLIITGGVDDKDQRLSSTELFDSNRRQWYKCSDIPQPHSELKSVIVENILYLLGGDNSAMFTAPLETLSTHQLTWDTYKDIPKRNSAPVSVNGRHLLIVGGHEGPCTSDIHKLNKVSHRWEAIGNIPSARSATAAVTTANNRVIVIGGKDDKYETTNTVWIGSCEPQ